MQLEVVGTFTYYQSPIIIWTYQQQQIPLFMYIIGADEVLEDIQNNFTINNLLPIVLAPSLLFLASCLLSWFVLSMMVNKLER